MFYNKDRDIVKFNIIKRKGLPCWRPFFYYICIMAKKIDIGSKEFSKLLEQTKFSPHKTYVKRIDSKMFSLDQNKVFSYKPELLAFKEFSRCLDLFQQRNPGLSPEQGAMRIAGIQNLIIKTESPYRSKLEELAINTIRDIYQVPDYVDMKAFIQSRLSLDTEQDDDAEPFLDLTLEQKNKMRDEIQKRIILNGLVHGSSMHVWKGIYHLVAQELDQINSELKELYNYYTSTLGITIWLMNPDNFQDSIEQGVQFTQGFNKLQFDKKKGFGGQLQANAINFPVLLHELNKGVIDWLISAGIPQDYTAEELRYYYSIADSYSNEVYHYTLSPSLWHGLLDTLQIENQELPKIISKLTKLSYVELTDLFRAIIDGIELGKIKAKKYKLI